MKDLNKIKSLKELKEMLEKEYDKGIYNQDKNSPLRLISERIEYVKRNFENY